MSGGNNGTPADTNYMYYKYINTPSDMGMEPGYDLSNISDGVAGITSYIQLLVEGRSNASKTGKPLGNKYFYKTSQTCKDPMGNIQPLALYVDNVPSGNLGIIPKGTPVAQIIPIKRKKWKMIKTQGYKDIYNKQGLMARKKETTYKKKDWVKKVFE